MPGVPFTVSHAAFAAVVPARVRTDAIVTGSVVPDFVYFGPVAVASTWTHSWWSPLLVALPSGIVVLHLWRHLFGPVAARMFVAAAMVPCRPSRPSRLRVSDGASIVAAAAVHAVWDSLTHASRPLARWAGFDRIVAGVPAATWLMHLSSVAGLVVVAVLCVRAVRVRQLKFHHRAVTVAGAAVVVCGVVAFAAVTARGVSFDAPVQVVGMIVRSWIRFTLTLALTAVAVVAVRDRWNQHR